jgi:hypothetical protein
MTTHFPDPTDVLNFKLTITPDEGELPSIDLFPMSDHISGRADDDRYLQRRRLQLFVRDQPELST